MSDATEIREALQQAIDEHPVILFMKGSPEQPACGFSARTVAALEAVGAPFAAVDILPDPRIRQELSAISNWPTIPQLFVNGELIGGADIVAEMFESGELHTALGVETSNGASGEAPNGRDRRGRADADREPARLARSRAVARGVSAGRTASRSADLRGRCTRLAA